MAEQGFVLDIDTKFLNNLKQADKALASAANRAQELTRHFQNVLTPTSTFAQRLTAIYSDLAKIGTVDMSSGIAKIDTSARTSVDAVNLLTNNMAKLKTEYNAINEAASGSKSRGTHMRITNDADLQNIYKLKAAIKSIDDELSKNRKKPLSLVDINSLNTQRDLYKRAIDELSLPDDKRTEKSVKNVKRRISELNKEAKAVIQANKEASKSDLARYELWLMKKHTEAKEHKRIEDEKYKATLEAIRKQNEAYAKQAAQQAAHNKQNTSAKEHGIEAKDKYERERRQYEKLYEERDRTRRKNEQKEADSQERIERANKRRAQQVIDDYNKETNAARKSYEERRRMYEQLWKEQERKSRSTVSGAMSFSAGAGSIAERRQAIKYLETARDNLSRSGFQTEKQYQREIARVNGEIRRQKAYIDQATGAIKNQGSALGALGNSLKAAFSLAAIQGFVNRLVSIRGEFELQQRALQAILQNKEEADALWKKVTALAVKSPFTVQQLTRSTKQLAAYRIEHDKLYDTTKMLADISAGVGVDMDRLILAYGQVKAANYLRGTELRQFSEAGINVLGELADYFTELEGRAVSTGDVFERISKRMVSFKDVEVVLQRVTSKGREFYNMQEIQSETLRGQISNLKDTLSLMFNDIGKSNDGILKTIVGMLKWLAESWRGLSSILTGVGVGLLILKSRTIAASVANGAYALSQSFATKATIGFNMSIKRLIVSLRALKTAMMSNPWVALATVIVGATVAIGSYVAKQNELEEQMFESTRAMREQSANMQIYITSLERLRKAQSDLNESNDEASEKEEKLNEIEKERKEIIEKLYEIAPDLRRANNATKNSMDQLIESAKAYNKELLTRISLEYQLSDKHSVEDDYNIDEAEKELKRAQKVYDKVLHKIGTYIGTEEYDSAAQIVLDSTKSLNEKKEALGAIGLDDKDLKRFERLAVDYKMVTERVRNASDELDVAYKRYAQYSLAGSVETFKAGNVEIYKALSNENPDIKAEAKAKTIKLFNSILDKKEIQGKAREAAKWYLTGIFGFEDWKIPNTFEATGWQKEYNDMLTESLKGIGKTGIPGISEVFSPDEEASKKLSEVESVLEELNKDVKTYNENPVQKVISKEDYEQALLFIPILEKLRELLGGSDKKREGGDEENRTLERRISLIKELNSKYLELRKTMGHTPAMDKVKSSYRDAFSEAFSGTSVNLDSYNFWDTSGANGVIETLKKLEPIAQSEGAKARLALQKEIGEVKVTVDVANLEEADKNFAKEIEDMFQGYELSIELDKLNIPQDFAKQFFGVQTFDLSSIKEKLQQEMAKGEAEIGKTMYEQIQKDLAKIQDLETKAQQERLKTYLAYTRDAVGERAKIKLEELKKLQEIELAFAPKDGETESDRKVRESAKASATEAVRQETISKEQKLGWEEFQKSETFISIFQDLDNASETLINHALKKLNEFKSAWKDMPHEDMKSIVGKISELETALAGVGNPFKAYRKLKEELQGEKSEQQAQIEIAQSEENIEAYEKELAVQEQIYSLRLEGKNLEANELAMLNDQHDLFGKNAEETKAIKDNTKGRIQDERDSIVANTKLIAKHRQLSELLLKIGEGIKSAQDVAKQLYGIFQDINSVLGDDDGPAAIFAEMGMNILDAIVNCIMLQIQLKTAEVSAYKFAAAMQAAMGPIGWIVMAVNIIANVLTAAFQAKDKGLERQIERIKEKLEGLQKAYERIEELMDEVFSASNIVSYTQAAKQNMEQQIAAYESMIALEDAKKKTDHGKIKEWKEQIEDLKESYQDLLEEGFSTATSGILDEVLGASRDFVDAWHDAFLETGSGLSGLEESFHDMFQEIVRQQAALTIVNPFVNRYKDWLKKYVDIENEDATLTAEEAREWANKVKETMPEVNALLENFFSGTSDLLSAGNGDLSDLSKGIQGVTENTAQILEGLLNSMRFFVADTNLRARNIEAAFTSNDVARNPILNELQQHTQLIRSIESMLGSVIGRGSSVHSGAYLKVLM